MALQVNENRPSEVFSLTILSTNMFMVVQPIASCVDMKRQAGAIQTSKNMLRILTPQFLEITSIILASIAPTIIVMNSLPIQKPFATYFSVAVVGWISYKFKLEEELNGHNLCRFNDGKYEQSGYWKVLAQNSVHQNVILLVAGLVGSAFAGLNIAIASVLTFGFPITEERFRKARPEYSMSLILSYIVTTFAWESVKAAIMIVKVLNSELGVNTEMRSQSKGLLIEEQDTQLWKDQSASFLIDPKETATEESVRHAR